MRENRLLVVGMSHRTAPLALRERFSFSLRDLPGVLTSLRTERGAGEPLADARDFPRLAAGAAAGVRGDAATRLGAAKNIEEAVVLSTCNRMELYLASKDRAEAGREVRDFLSFRSRLAPERFESSLYSRTDDDAVRHLFRVTAGLDSMILGETEITAQVKQAYEVAHRLGATGPFLNRLFQKALHAAKEIRSKTGIGFGQASIGSVVAALARRIFGDRLSACEVLLWGAGKAAEVTARHLMKGGIGSLWIVNRTENKAQALASLCRGGWLSWEEALKHLAHVDIAIVCTQAPHYVVEASDLEKLFPQRGTRPLFLIDLAVPRNVDPSLKQMPGVHLYDIDALQTIAQATLDSRQGEMARGEALVEEQVRHFWRGISGVPFQEMRRSFMSIRAGAFVGSILLFLGTLVGPAWATLDNAKGLKLAYPGLEAKAYSCKVCHLNPIGKKGDLNPYGLALQKLKGPGKALKLTPEDFKAIEAEDADGDKIPNGQEIRAGASPGDPASIPKEGGKTSFLKKVPGTICFLDASLKRYLVPRARGLKSLEAYLSQWEVQEAWADEEAKFVQEGKAEYVGMETCAACHARQHQEFKNSTHARISVPKEGLEVQGCEMCHGPGSLHAEAGGGRGVGGIKNPRKDPSTCFSCHMDKKAEFRLPHHHPVMEGKMSCADCHNAHGTDVRPWSATSLKDINEACFKCHKEQRGPFVWEHEALREGCTNCHKVHGSIHEKMLIIRDSNLCLRCHVQANFPTIGKRGHASNLPAGTCFSAGCHTAPHGSNFDEHLRY